MDLRLRPSRNSNEVRAAFESRMDRDLPSWRDILTDFTQDQGNNLIKFCIEYYDIWDNGPDGLVKPLASADCFILMAAYVKIGQIGLPDAQSFFVSDVFSHGYCQLCLNNDGRVRKIMINPETIPYVHVGEGEYRPEYRPYNLPGFITNLQYLEELTVVHCRSIRDVDLSLLPNLKKLMFSRCRFLWTGEQWEQKKLPYLKTFEIYESTDMSARQDFISWMTSQLPVLEEISFLGERSKIEPFLDALGNDNVCFQDNLKSISFGDVDLSNNDTFKKLINSVLPKFPNLTYVGFSKKAGSFKDATNETNDIGSLSAYLRRPLTFRLYYSQMKEIKDQTEITALLKFLEINSNVISLGLSVERPDYHPQVKYALLINHAGRADVQNNSNNSNRSSSPIPPSILPKFLERAYVKSGDIYTSFTGSPYPPGVAKKDHTGVYYLLRQNIPALVLSSVTATKDGDVNAVPSSKKQKRDNNETNN